MTEAITDHAQVETQDEPGGAISVAETFLTADAIFAADDTKTETVDVPEWGGKVIVRGMTGVERDAFLKAITTVNMKTKKPDNDNVTARFLSLCIVNPDGSYVFNNRAAVLALGRKNGGVLMRLNAVADRLSGFGDAAAADAEGNSDDTPSAGSTSSEPKTPESP